MLALLLRKFDNQDSVLGGEADENDHADLRVEIQRQPASRIARNAPNTPTETDSRTGTGMIQLS